MEGRAAGSRRGIRRSGRTCRGNRRGGWERWKNVPREPARGLGAVEERAAGSRRGLQWMVAPQGAGAGLGAVERRGGPERWKDVPRGAGAEVGCSGRLRRGEPPRRLGAVEGCAAGSQRGGWVRWKVAPRGASEEVGCNGRMRRGEPVQRMVAPRGGRRGLETAEMWAMAGRQRMASERVRGTMRKMRHLFGLEAKMGSFGISAGRVDEGAARGRGATLDRPRRARGRVRSQVAIGAKNGFVRYFAGPYGISSAGRDRPGRGRASAGHLPFRDIARGGAGLRNRARLTVCK